jgi:hypothetical protein
MPQPEPATTLPTIQQRIDADYLAANFDALTQARVSGLLARDADNDLERARVLPSTQLRDLVHHGAAILHDAHLAATPIERLGRQSLQRLVEARHALTELNTREAAALDQLEADPPGYLVATIGRPTPLLRPTDGISRRAWRDLAGRIQAYRLQYNIVDPTRTLGPRTGALSQLADRSRVATDIAWSGFGLLPGRADPGWLNVIGPPDHDPADALAALHDPAWPPTVLPSVTIAAIQARPSAVLRRHAEQALGLLRRRPPDQADQRAHLQAISRQLTRLADQPPKPVAAIASKVEQRLAEVRATLQELDQAYHARLDWDATYTHTMATGRVAARELRRRELQVLLQLAEDPPAYLTHQLGQPPPGQAPHPAWLHGARAIIAYRTTHHIDSPYPLGPIPTDDLARIHHTIAQRHLNHAKQRLAPRELEPPHRLGHISAGVESPDAMDLPG